jgi:hypothetical protein
VELVSDAPDAQTAWLRPEKEEALEEARFSNCIFAVTVAEMFGYLSPVTSLHFALAVAVLIP